jgi:hypothetical protein
VKHTGKGRFKGLLILAFLSIAVPSFAHHSVTAEFDPGKELTVTGVLSKVLWVNPHVYWFVDVKDENGKVETWSFEGNPPGMYHRAGVRKDDWKIGEEVTVTAVAAKDGSKHLGFAKTFKFADGRSIALKVGGE